MAYDIPYQNILERFRTNLKLWKIRLTDQSYLRIMLKVSYRDHPYSSTEHWKQWLNLLGAYYSTTTTGVYKAFLDAQIRTKPMLGRSGQARVRFDGSTYRAFFPNSRLSPQALGRMRACIVICCWPFRE